MPWDDLTTAPPPEDDRARQEQEALDRRWATMLGADENYVATRHLQQIAHSRSYRPGREVADTAWSEGYRALAIELLGRAGKLP